MFGSDQEQIRARLAITGPGHRVVARVHLPRYCILPLTAKGDGRDTEVRCVAFHPNQIAPRSQAFTRKRAIFRELGTVHVRGQTRIVVAVRAQLSSFDIPSNVRNIGRAKCLYCAPEICEPGDRAVTVRVCRQAGRINRWRRVSGKCRRGARDQNAQKCEALHTVRIPLLVFRAATELGPRTSSPFFGPRSPREGRMAC